MLVFFTKSQLALFDAPVHVAAHVRKDGTVVQPHVRIQKLAVKQHSLFGGHHAAPEPAKRRSKLDTFLGRYGGPAGMAKILAGLPEGQQQQLIAKMAEVGKTTPEAVWAMLGAAPKPAQAEPAAEKQADLFSQAPEAPKTDSASAKPVAEPEPSAKPIPAAAPAPDLPLVEYRTAKKGKCCAASCAPT